MIVESSFTPVGNVFFGFNVHDIIIHKQNFVNTSKPNLELFMVFVLQNVRKNNVEKPLMVYILA